MHFTKSRRHLGKVILTKRHSGKSTNKYRHIWQKQNDWQLPGVRVKGGMNRQHTVLRQKKKTLIVDAVMSGYT